MRPWSMTALAWAVTVSGCGTLHVPAHQPAPLAVAFEFDRRHACGEGPYKMQMARLSHTSPRLTVNRVPPGTAAFKVEMVDLDLMRLDHGGSDVPVAAGSATVVVPEGALASWAGPCPPTGSDHRYEIRVEARDAQGAALASGKGMRPCCRRFE